MGNAAAFTRGRRRRDARVNLTRAMSRLRDIRRATKTAAIQQKRLNAMPRTSNRRRSRCVYARAAVRGFPTQTAVRAHELRLARQTAAAAKNQRTPLDLQRSLTIMLRAKTARRVPASAVSHERSGFYEKVIRTRGGLPMRRARRSRSRGSRPEGLLYEGHQLRGTDEGLRSARTQGRGQEHRREDKHGRAGRAQLPRALPY